MKQCIWCPTEATFRVEGYAECGQDGGFVYQDVCDEHVKSYYGWLEDDDCDEEIHGLEYITEIDNVNSGDRIIGHTRLTRISKGKFVMEDEGWEATICDLEFGPIICNILTDEQLSTMAHELRRRIFDVVRPLDI